MEGIEFFNGFSKYTDPGKYSKMYEDLPSSVHELTKLVRDQIIHPFELEKKKDLEARRKEEIKLRTVRDMLARLKTRNSKGLIRDRKPSERVVVSCRHASLLLSSILKYKGIPSRTRTGFASYLSPPPLPGAEDDTEYIDHWICEYWDRGEEWKLADPDIADTPKKFDIGDPSNVPKSKFVYAWEAWERAREDKIDLRAYGMSRKALEFSLKGTGFNKRIRKKGMEAIRNALVQDLFCVLGREIFYWEGPDLIRRDIGENSKGTLKALDKLLELLKSPENNLKSLRRLSKLERFDF